MRKRLQLGTAADAKGGGKYNTTTSNSYPTLFFLLYCFRIKSSVHFPSSFLCSLDFSSEICACEQDIFQACRVWTIAVYQHVIQNDYSIRVLGTAMSDHSVGSHDHDDDTGTGASR